MNQRKPLSILLFVLCCAAAWSPAMADVVILKTGEPRYGMVKEAPNQPDYIILVWGGGESQIRVAPPDQSRVSKIVREPEATSWRRIGDDLSAKQLYAEALECYEKALKADPQSAEAKQRIGAVKQEMDRLATEDRKGQVKETSELLRGARKASEKGEFPDAQKQLAKAETFNPSESQKEEIRNIRIQMLVDWGLNRLNHMDNVGAAEKFEGVLSLAPRHVRATEELIKLYLTDPSKSDRVAQLLETKHQDNPKDYQTIKNLADLAFREKQREKALSLYRTLYDKADMRGTDVADRLRILLEQSRDDAASKGEYETAIACHKDLMARFPDTDPRALDIYEFGLRSSRLKEKDAKGWIELAKWARGKEMDKQALEIFQKVQDWDPENAEAAQGVDQYARLRLKEADESYSTGAYEIAKALYLQIQKDFPKSQEVAVQASVNGQKCDLAIQTNKRRNEERALNLLAQGDGYYERARSAETNMQFGTKDSTFRAPIVNPRRDAIHYYELAIVAYSEALNLAPNMPEAARARTSMQDAQQMKSRLESPIDYGLPKFSKTKNLGAK